MEVVQVAAVGQVIRGSGVVGLVSVRDDIVARLLDVLLREGIDIGEQVLRLPLRDIDGWEVDFDLVFEEVLFDVLLELFVPVIELNVENYEGVDDDQEAGEDHDRERELADAFLVPVLIDADSDFYLSVAEQLSDPDGGDYEEEILDDGIVGQHQVEELVVSSDAELVEELVKNLVFDARVTDIAVLTLGRDSLIAFIACFSFSHGIIGVLTVCSETFDRIEEFK